MYKILLDCLPASVAPSCLPKPLDVVSRRCPNDRRRGNLLHSSLPRYSLHTVRPLPSSACMRNYVDPADARRETRQQKPVLPLSRRRSTNNAPTVATIHKMLRYLLWPCMRIFHLVPISYPPRDAHEKYHLLVPRSAACSTAECCRIPRACARTHIGSQAAVAATATGTFRC